MLELKPNLEINRRQFLILTRLFSTSIGMSIAVSSCDRLLNPRASQASDNHLVNIGYIPITDAAPLLAAYDKGFYRSEGLEVSPPQQYYSWDAISQAFINREVNVVHLLMPTTVWIRYGLNVPGKVVAWNHTNGSAITVLPNIDHPSQLGGQTIAIPSWYSIHNIVLQLLLRQYGLEPIVQPTDINLQSNQVQLAVLSPLDMLSALSKGDISGYIIAEPYNLAAETTGAGKLLRLTGDIWKDHACCVVFMHEDDIRDRPEWTQKVVNAIVKSQQWSRSNRLELAHLLSLDGSKYMPYPVSVLEQVLTSYDSDYYTRTGAMIHPEWRSQRIDFQPYPFPSYTRSLVEQLKKTLIQDNISFLEQLSADFVVEDLVDDSFVKQALMKVGGPQVFGLSLDLSRTEEVHI
ncbi:ABC transporter substrate-binding protein [Roseofilum sp. Guam]|uniref:ABC transporter substrate-binding protein n=1 Tax=Roseofilum sp. Guam TaxID=2821502 RepID=UPI001B2CE862|nr:ABC transporter substrate-binding protein [Roseofilum sp. Guam]MBP0030322.1 ABC transporter substrate-binding protein [Roseofilum sp. Guam]